MNNETIVSALKELLTAEEIDRIRLNILSRYGTRLLKIPGAPTPDDLLHETIEDLLAGRRYWPRERVTLKNCLYNIISSKFSHLCEKWGNKGIVIVSDEALKYEEIKSESEEQSELRETMLALVANDALLTSIVEYHLEHPEEQPIKAQKLADAIGVDVKQIYNANKRLRTRLKDLIS